MGPRRVLFVLTRAIAAIAVMMGRRIVSAGIAVGIGRWREWV
jgi:hypothetical protein